jgi:hypothetical protein
MEVRELDKSDLDEWSKLVKNSKHGCVFHSLAYISSNDDGVNIVGCFHNNELIAGMPIQTKNHYGILSTATSSPQLAPFGGIVYTESQSPKQKKKDSHRKKIFDSIMGYLSDIGFDGVDITFPYSVTDIRPFIWNGWDTQVKYTYMLNISNINMSDFSRDARTDISQANEQGVRVKVSEDIQLFYSIYQKTFENKGMDVPANKRYIERIYNQISNNDSARLYLAESNAGEPIAGEIYLFDESVAHRWVAGTNPELRDSGGYSLLLYTAMEELSEEGINKMNMMGGNIENLSRYASKFNPRLKPYYTAKFQSAKLNSLGSFRDLVNIIS